MENYYQILGVDEKATQDEIKKAYRKKAVEHHPDKGGSEEIFKKIASAYDVLGDENKRRDYDMRKNNPFQGQQGFNPFEEFFNSNFYQPRKKSVPEKVVELNVGVVDSYTGCDKDISFFRKHSCNNCGGKGGDRVECGSCKGQGFVTIRQGTGLFVQLMRHICESCRGNGFSLSNRCFACNGEGTISTHESFGIKLSHGVESGQQLRIKSKGDFHQNTYGDLIIKINVIPQNNFEKFGRDLVYNLFYDIEDLKKDTIQIPHPNGTISVNLPNEVDTSKPLRIKSKGFNINGFGDLLIRQFVKFKRNS